MKKFLNLSRGKKIIGALVLAGVLGSASTVAVLAAIPDSDTGVISACRNNLSGSLRAIDAQSSATCNSLETSLSWQSDPVAYVTMNDGSDSNGMPTPQITATASRGVTDVKYVSVLSDPEDPNSVYRIDYLCFNVSFVPRMAYDTSIGNMHIQVYTSSTDSATVQDHCGTGWNVAIAAGASTGTGNYVFIR
jgi:hypothetical protein